MKITSVKTFPVREPVDGGPGRQYVIIKIKTDAGISGLGEAGIHFRGQAIERAVAHLSELLLGEGPLVHRTTSEANVPGQRLPGRHRLP